MQLPGVSFMTVAAASEAPWETDAEGGQPTSVAAGPARTAPAAPGMVPGQPQRASLDPPLEQKQQQWKVPPWRLVFLDTLSAKGDPCRGRVAADTLGQSQSRPNPPQGSFFSPPQRYLDMLGPDAHPHPVGARFGSRVGHAVGPIAVVHHRRRRLAEGAKQISLGRGGWDLWQAARRATLTSSPSACGRRSP